VSAFLNGAHVALENPYKLRDMPKAVQRILRALEKQETICVYGDFDVDGVASTALLVTALQALGGRVGPYIPDRVDEGYGLNRDAILRIAGQAHLLITVDCGIRSIGEVACAVEHGLDVIVTDHHSVGKDLPPALAVINPRRSDCPNLLQNGLPASALPFVWPRPCCVRPHMSGGRRSRLTRCPTWRPACWTLWRSARWQI
jgi:single-stranded-DNA-specific exonuclease